jgi:hypothetical protein
VRAKPADRFYADFSTLRRNEKDRLPRQARDKTGGKLNQKGGAFCVLSGKGVVDEAFHEAFPGCTSVG